MKTLGKLCTALLCALIMAGPSWAEAPKTEEPAVQYMDDMVITSTRTEKRVIETPSNISVITAEDIKNMDVKTLPDILVKIPGAFMTDSSGLEPKISLRGTRIGMSGGALVLLNGIPMNLGKFGYMDWESIPVDNVARVEVVKGPMSALYGGDSSRGVVNITTRRTGEKCTGNVSAAIGEGNDQRYSARVAGGLEKWEYSVSAKKRDQDGYRDESELDSFFFNGEAGYWFSDDTRLGFYFNAGEKERILAKKLTAAQREEDRRQTPDYSDTKNTDIIAGMNLETKKEAFDVSATVYYKNRDKNFENYLLATSTPYREDLKEDVFGARGIFTWKKPVFGRKNNLSVGFDYDNDQSDLETVKAASKAIGAPYTKPDLKKTGDFKRTELGLFLQEEFSPMDNLTITAGIRYDHFKFDNNADYDFSSGGKYDYDKTPSYDKWNPRISVNYQPVKTLGFYAGYSESYRAPTVYDYYYSGSHSAKNGYTLEPEQFTQYEAGFRWSQSKYLNVDLSVFRIEIEDLLDTAYSETGKYMGKQNIGEATMKGVEISLMGAPLEIMNYRIGYTYTDARYAEDYLAKATKSTLVNINGNRLSKTPYHTLSADLNTRLCKWNGGELNWQVNMTLQSSFEMDKVNTGSYGGYTLFNTKLRMKHKAFEAFIAVDNLTDKEYDGYAYASYGKNYYYPAAGRTVAAGISYSF